MPSTSPATKNWPPNTKLNDTTREAPLSLSQGRAATQGSITPERGVEPAGPSCRRSKSCDRTTESATVLVRVAACAT